MAHIISYKQLPRLRLGTAAKETLAYGLSLLFVILFLYTVYHKAVAIDAFARGIAKIPLVGTYSEEVAWGVLGAEALVALLLIWPDTNRLALWGALGLMVIFTVYIGATLLFVEKIPCHCGGAIEKLTWGQHLLFNCGFIALAAGLLLYHYKVNVKHKIFTAMKAINSKIKKAIFGMMVAAVTIGFSAFTVVRSNSHLAAKHWGNDGDGNYSLIEGTPNPMSCSGQSSDFCVLQSDDETIPDEFTLDEAAEEGYDVTPLDPNNRALYTPQP